ncbi:MAG: hypothetical protein FWF44_10630, partial [Defluviitaleaceae bacterium]|nr:hypothetical protein [Defluviitaleaceae bacterium]
MKIRDMDVYFTVPVDRGILAACREKAGYRSANDFKKELRRRGYPITYDSIERGYKTNTAAGDHIRGDVAELIATVLGRDVSEVFPQYAAAKTAAEREVEADYYKPFTTIAERDAAIVKAIEPVRYTALKYCILLKNQNGGHFLEQDDIIAIAYETLVHMATRAMKKGIHKGTCFEAAACVAVRQEFLRLAKQNRVESRAADVVSYEAYFCIMDACSSYDLEDHIVRRDEVRRAVDQL